MHDVFFLDTLGMWQVPIIKPEDLQDLERNLMY